MMNNKEAIEDIYNRYSNLDKKQDKFFRKRIRQSNPNVKYIATILCILLLSSSISIGNNFFNYRSKSNVGYLDEGLYTAIANNYMQNISMNYKKSNNVGVKVSNVLVDSSKIYLAFDFKFYKPLKNNVNLLELPDMLITNESNDILYCDNLQKYNKFCKDNNLIQNEKYSNQNILCSNYTSQLIEKDQNHIKYLIVLNAKDNYPKSTKLNISFENILLYDNLSLDSYNKVEPIKKSGNWNIQLELENKETINNSIIFSSPDNKYISNIRLIIGETCSYLTFIKNTDFALEKIEILDENNNSYSPLSNMTNSLKIEGNMVKLFLPITQILNLSNLKLHLITNKFDKKFILSEN